MPEDYTDPEVDSISIPDILAVYATRAAWSRDTQSALEASTQHRKGLIAQIMYLNALRNTKAALLRDRTDRLHGNDCEMGLAENLRNWVHFCARLPDLSTEALKRATWCELLEIEYRKMEPEWNKFWDYQESAHKQLWSGGYEYRDKKHDFCTLLKQHCAKKNFLQRKIVESRDILLEIYAPELPWLEMDCRFMRCTAEDGWSRLKPVFFTEGNKYFVDSGKTLAEIGAEIQGLGIAIDSNDGDNGDNGAGRIVEEIEDGPGKK